MPDFKYQDCSESNSGLLFYARDRPLENPKPLILMMSAEESFDHFGGKKCTVKHLQNNYVENLEKVIFLEF